MVRMATIPSCSIPWFTPGYNCVRSPEGMAPLYVPLTMPTRLKQTFAPLNIGFPPHALPVTASSCLLDEPISANVVPVWNNHVLPRSWLLFRSTAVTQLRVPVSVTPRDKCDTYPMNHAPLFARLPFCFHTRKWCPPAGGSVPVRVNR